MNQFILQRMPERNNLFKINLKNGRAFAQNSEDLVKSTALCDRANRQIWQQRYQ